MEEDLYLFCDYEYDPSQLDNVPAPSAELPEQQGHDPFALLLPLPAQEPSWGSLVLDTPEAPAQHEAGSFDSTSLPEEEQPSLTVETEEFFFSLGQFTTQTDSDSSGDLPFTALNSAVYTPPVSTGTTRPPKVKPAKVAKAPKAAPKHNKRRLKEGEKSIRYDKPVYIWLQGFARYRFCLERTLEATERTLKKFGTKRATSNKVESSGHFCLIKVEETEGSTKVTWKINSGEEKFYSAYRLEIYGIDEFGQETPYCVPQVYQIGSSGERKCYTREIEIVLDGLLGIAC